MNIRITSKRSKIRHKYRRFCFMNQTGDLAIFLNCPLEFLENLANEPPYQYFQMPKQSGELRDIESPEKPLMDILKKINSYLQCVYYYFQTDAAYGFVINCKRDESYARNILTNAQQHLLNPYLLNVDLKDFFHQIKMERLIKLFVKPPFDFSDDLALLLAKLCTNKGRLPMGTPTSPCLSNWVSIALDEELLAFAKRNRMRYTRYADDLTFSSLNLLNHKHLEQIQHILASHQFELNAKKTKFYGENDVRIVTGLELHDKVRVPNHYFDVLEEDLINLKSIYQMHGKMGFINKNKWIEKAEQRVSGKVNFLGFVYGYDSTEYEHFTSEYENALNCISDFDQVSWLDFPY